MKMWVCVGIVKLDFMYKDILKTIGYADTNEVTYTEGCFFAGGVRGVIRV